MARDPENGIGAWPRRGDPGSAPGAPYLDPSNAPTSANIALQKTVPPRTSVEVITQGMSTLREKTYTTASPEETMELGRTLAREIRPPRLVLLVGDLGSGKTTLAKGLIEGLDAAAPEDVLSPTFSLIHEYEGPPKVYHIDLYRLDRLPELETLGLDDLWDQQAVVFVEWGEKFAAQLPAPRLEIHLEDCGDDKRRICIVDHPAW